MKMHKYFFVRFRSAKISFESVSFITVTVGAINDMTSFQIFDVLEVWLTNSVSSSSSSRRPNKTLILLYILIMFDPYLGWCNSEIFKVATNIIPFPRIDPDTFSISDDATTNWATPPTVSVGARWELIIVIGNKILKLKGPGDVFTEQDCKFKVYQNTVFFINIKHCNASRFYLSFLKMLRRQFRNIFSKKRNGLYFAIQKCQI